MHGTETPLMQRMFKRSQGSPITVVTGSVAERQFVALYGRAGRLRGVLGMNAPRQVMPFRNLLLERISWEAAQARARML